MGKATMSTTRQHFRDSCQWCFSVTSVACTLLDRQIKAQAEAFQNEGGFTERLYRTRINGRNGQKHNVLSFCPFRQVRLSSPFRQ